jgi:hypothetical protein
MNRTDQWTVPRHSFVPVNLANNRIRDVTPLPRFSHVGFLKLQSNLIENIAPLAETFCTVPLGPGDGFGSLDLRENPFDCAANAAAIETRKKRGVDLFTDCQ